MSTMITTASNQTLIGIDRTPSFVGEDIKPIRLPVLQTFQDETQQRKLSFKAEPRILQFQNFIPGRVYTLSTQIQNISTNVLRIYVTQPVTKWFGIIVKKENNLLPGFSIDINIKFKPDEERYFYDCVNVSSQIGENLHIPIHAFFTEPSLIFPSTIELKKTSAGECSTRIIKIRCSSPVDLKFVLRLKPQLPFVTVAPSKGILPFTGDSVEILLMFKPHLNLTKFQQSLIITITNINMNIYTSKIVLLSTPSKPKLKFLTLAEQKEAAQRLQDMRLQRQSHAKRYGSHYEESDTTKSQLLTKISLREIKKEKSAGREKSLTTDRKSKELEFLASLRAAQEEEKLRHIKWRPKLGKPALSIQEKRVIILEREEHWKKFRQYVGLDGELALKRTETEYARKPSLVNADLDNPSVFTFNLNAINDWPSRFMALNRFVQAAWKIMARYRAEKRLVQLRKLTRASTKKVKEKKVDEKPVFNFKWNVENFTPKINKLFWNYPEKMNLLFPKLKKKFETESLSCEPEYKPKPVEVMTPLLYEILGYKPFDVQKAKHDYIPLAPKEPTHPECQLNEFLATCTVSEQNKKAQITLAPSGKLLETKRLDFPSAINPLPNESIYLRLPTTTELDQDYALYPLNKWRYHDLDKLTGSIDELTDHVMEWKNYTFPSQVYFEHCDEDDFTIDSIKVSNLKNYFGDNYTEPKLEENVSEESTRLLDSGSVSIPENYPANLEELLKEKIVYSETKSSTDLIAFKTN